MEAKRNQELKVQLLRRNQNYQAKNLATKVIHSMSKVKTRHHVRDLRVVKKQKLLF